MRLLKKQRRAAGNMSPGSRSLLAALALATAFPAAADVYVRVDEEGVVHLTDQLAPGYRPVERPSARPQSAGRPGFMDTLVEDAALRYRLDPFLVDAVIRIESNYDPRAVSSKGAAGLMQLMPQTARRYGVADPFDAAQNVDAGARYLRDLLVLFDWNLQLALAAYNSGEGVVLRNGRRVPPYAESQQYVRRVTRLYDSLRSSRVVD